MTQNTFAPPVPETDGLPFEPESAGRSRRTLLIAGGAVAALVLGGGGYLLLSGGSSSAPAPAPVIHFGASSGKTTPKKVLKPAVKPAAQLPPTTSVPIGRDPFRALYLLPVAAPATNTTPAGPTATTTTTTGTTTSTGSTSGTTTPTTYKLQLKSVDSSGTTPVGTFTVGGKTMVAKQGSVFGPTSELKLLSLTQDPKLG